MEEKQTATDIKIMEQKTDADAPRSLVAGKTRHKIDLLESKCFNIFYDGLTIFISIADVATDIMVLISYYNDDRTAFFVISLVILLLAQFGYVMVFLFTFNIDDFFDTMTNNLEVICCDFKLCSVPYDTCKQSCCINKSKNCCCCKSRCMKLLGKCVVDSLWSLVALTALAIAMIFGHLVAFLMYFAENEESKTFKFLHKWFGIVKRQRFGRLEKHLSQQTKFAIEKINKHGKFYMYDQMIDVF